MSNKITVFHSSHILWQLGESEKYTVFAEKIRAVKLYEM